MHVLILASYGPSLVNFRGPLIRELVARGHKVSVASPGCSVGAQAYKELRSLGVVDYEIPLSRTGTSLLADLTSFLHILRLVLKTHPDVVLTYTIKPVIYGSIAAWLARVDQRFAFVTGLGFNFTGGRSGGVMQLVRWMYRFALGKVNKVFFQNRDDERLFADLGILSRKTPTVIVNGSGVDLSHFDVAPLPVGKPTFLMICRLLGDKGVREYSRAAHKLHQKREEVCIRLIGWIDENPDSISPAELDEWVKSGNIEFLGYLDDVRPAIAGANVYVLPSYREGTPRTVLEAMAMGRPVITTDAPGCRETVIEGDNGFLVPVKSVDALAEAMQKFIDDPKLAIRMGKRSREIAEEKYDVHKVNAVMLREMGIS